MNDVRSEATRSAIAQVLSIMDAIEAEMNDVGPLGNGYRWAMGDLRRNLQLRFASDITALPREDQP